VEHDLVEPRDLHGVVEPEALGQGVTHLFPEIDYDSIDTTRGMDITIVTTARSDAEGRALLDAFGFPFRREG
ncbi:MAG: hypothetical protein AAGK32_15875, partial [Actinomycetota bacterium]